MIVVKDEIYQYLNKCRVKSFKKFVISKYREQKKPTSTD